ncbi:MAG: efflux RND transporter periplasmic adaptor subunit [Gemmataceae bacterium]
MRQRTLILAVLMVLVSLPELWAQPPAAVIVEPVKKKKDLSVGQLFVGTVMPTRIASVGSAVGGRVEKFLVIEGDRVKKGTPLAQLRTQIIAAEVDVAKGELALRQAELEEMIGALPEEIEQAKARANYTQALHELRVAKRTRMLQLQGRSVAREEVEEAVSLANQSEEQLREAKAALKLLEGPRQKKIAQMKARVQAQEAEVRRLSEMLDRHTIYAPFDGYITAEKTESGQWVQQGDLVAEVSELDFVDVEVAVVEDYISLLNIGDTVRVEIAALPKETFTGEVAIIVPAGNMRARTFPVKVRVKNKEGGKSPLLKAGMFARVLLPVGKKQAGLLVPKDALVLGGARRVVYVVEDGKVRALPVELGVCDGDWIQVTGDLKEGQQVVVQGNERLRDGQSVNVIPDTSRPKSAQ